MVFFIRKKYMTVINDTDPFVAEDDAECEDDKPTLEKLVERGVANKREATILKDDFAVIAAKAKQLFAISKRDFNALVKYSSEADIDDDIKELVDIQTKLSNLGDPAQADLFDDQDTD